MLGACPAGAHLYLAYELPPGAATLAVCLRSTRSPSFTALRTWVSRVQVAADVAQGLEYVHHHAGAVHGRVSASAVIVSNPGLRARLTHFGAAELAAPADASKVEDSPYAAPGSSEPSHEADVYSFGVLLLELLSGEEPARYRFDRGTKEFQRVSVLETAAVAAVESGVRNWVDRSWGTRSQCRPRRGWWRWRSGAQRRRIGPTIRGSRGRCPMCIWRVESRV
uniref:Protein kinase domain-containing protein n=1 Tax=Zea mays TaxID=4577 RepID=A0A804QX68_MAIZE